MLAVDCEVRAFGEGVLTAHPDTSNPVICPLYDGACATRLYFFRPRFFSFACSSMR
jgi:hypothetical protein